jgi:hypothetical protein
LSPYFYLNYRNFIYSHSKVKIISISQLRQILFFSLKKRWIQ